MKSTPVSAMARTVLEVDAARCLEGGPVARSALPLAGPRPGAGVRGHVVEQEDGRSGLEPGRNLIEIAALHLDCEIRRGHVRAAPTAFPRPPARAMWFSLMRKASKSPMRWLLPPPGCDGRLLQRAQARCGLARVEYASACSRHRLYVASGQRGDAREMPEKVEGRALGREQRPRRAARRGPPRPAPPRATAPRRRGCRRARPRTGTWSPPPRQPEDGAGLFLHDPGPGARLAGTVTSEVTSPPPTSSARARATIVSCSGESAIGRSQPSPAVDLFPQRTSEAGASLSAPAGPRSQFGRIRRLIRRTLTRSTPSDKAVSSREWRPPPFQIADRRACR